MKCVHCKEEIKDERYDTVWIDPRYPDIDIGPLCPICLADSRICSKCHFVFHKSQVIDTTDKNTYLCSECMDK